MELARSPRGVAGGEPRTSWNGRIGSGAGSLELLKKVVDVSDEKAVRGAIPRAFPLRSILPLEMKLTAVSDDNGIARRCGGVGEDESKAEALEEGDGRGNVAGHEDGVDCLDHGGLEPTAAKRLGDA